MIDKIDYSLLRNYSAGKYSYRDYKRIASWFEDDSLRSELETTIHQHWNDFSVNTEESPKDLRLVYENLRSQILSEEPKPISLNRRVILLYSRIAAILLFPLLIYSTISLIKSNNHEVTAWAEICAPAGARTQFMLPDGSKGWLNSNAKLKYSLDFKQNRHVNLSGEAYFEVTKDKKKPFTVSTPNLDVKVVGTIFSVSALEEENTTEVVLQEGSVEVDNPAIGLNALMKPDQKLVYDNTKKKYQTSTLNAQQYNTWKDGMLIFRNEPLSDVFKRMSRWYNIKITITDEQIKRYKYRATFREEPVEEVIRLIALTVPIEFLVQQRTMNDDGVFSVKEITIRKR